MQVLLSKLVKVNKKISKNIQLKIMCLELLF